MQTDLCAPGYGVGNAQIKGDYVRVLTNEQRNLLSDKFVDFRFFNTAHVDVYVGGTGTATITVMGAPEQGGNYLALPDPQATQTGVASNFSFDCIVGAAWAKIQLSAYAGTGNYTVIVTAYQSPGQSQISITNTASQNLTQYAGVAVGTGNPVDVRETVGTYTTMAEIIRTVGITSATALSANVNRLYALFINDSDSDIYLGIGVAAIVNAGIRLNALGGSYEMSKPQGNLTTVLINAISAGAAKTLLVNEGT